MPEVEQQWDHPEVPGYADTVEQITGTRPTGPYTPSPGLGEILMDSAANAGGKLFATPAKYWFNSMVENPYKGALIGGLGTGLAGLGVGGLMSLFGSKISPWKLALLAGSLGAAGSLGGGTIANMNDPARKKQASFLLGPDQEIVAEIARDYTLTSSDKQELARYVDMLPENKKLQLASMLKGATGSTIGVLVARYLMKMGIVGQIVMALAGGMMGMNAFGPDSALANLGKTQYAEAYTQ
jgi:hypothetical protein